jgi:hypothetical protein
MNQLDRLIDGVKDTSDLRAASVKMMSNLAAELSSTIGNDSAGAALHQTLLTHAAHLADCLLASTPMIVATHPIPDDVVIADEPEPEIEKLPGDDIK